MKPIVLAITGASGALYARRLAQSLVAADCDLHLVISPHGADLLKTELGLHDAAPATLLEQPAPRVVQHAYDNQAARIASGSYITGGMVICPCTSNTLAAIAAGTAGNLITRAAQVTLKERRPLIVVPREAPLSTIDLANMLRVSEAGAVVCPASPGFYHQPRTITDLVDFVVARVLDLLQVPHDLRTRWNPPAGA